MKHVRLCGIRAAALCIGIFLAAGVGNGQTTEKGAEPRQCGGADMLADFANTDPKLYEAVMKTARELDNGGAVLWKIEKAGTPASYLFGTVHLSDPRVATLSDNVKSALGEVKSVAVEVADLSDEAMSKAMINSVELVMYTDGQNLGTKISPEELSQVQELASKAGMPGEATAMMRPWIINLMLSVSECERSQVAAGFPVLDMILTAEAKTRGLKVSGLETIEQQLASLATIPEDQQIMMLKSGLKFASRSDDMMETLIQLYLKRNIGAAMPFQLALAAKSGTPEEAFDGLNKSLVVDRNLRMRDGIVKLIEKGPVFVGVGALHLPGKAGLVALLKDAGYTLSPLE